MWNSRAKWISFDPDQKKKKQLQHYLMDTHDEFPWVYISQLPYILYSYYFMKYKSIVVNIAQCAHKAPFNLRLKAWIKR